MSADALPVSLSLSLPLTGLPAPIDAITLPATLSGANGTNRAPRAACQLGVDDDVGAAAAWLARYRETPATVQTYRREAERLLMWGVYEAGKPLSSLTHRDLLAYQRFLEDPQPAARWVMTSRKRVARGHPDWRPFAGRLSPASVRQALVILNALFAWLTEAGYLAGNPLALARRRQAPVAPRIERYLDQELWNAVKTTVATLPGTQAGASARARLHAARCRWLISLLYLAGLRASEVLDTTMGAFFSRRDTTGMDRWWLEIRGKGGKVRLVPATDSLMAELGRYREAHALHAIPARGETRPLLFPVIGQERTMSRGALHLILKEIFERAASYLRLQGPEQESRAALLEKASAHWLRHTAGSHMANSQVDLRYVRDNLGHRSLATTNVYLHAEDDARHEATQSHHRLDW